MRTIILLFVVISCFASDGLAGSLVWQTSEPDAIALATQQGKLILLIAGNKGCGNCERMKKRVCESTSPAVKSLIKKHFIPWYCDIDSCFEWHAYNIGLKKLTMPMICTIDPAKLEYLDRTVGLQSPREFHFRLKKIVSGFRGKSGNRHGETVSDSKWKSGKKQADCAGVPGGRAYLDDCGNCVGGTTAMSPCSKAECSMFGKVTDTYTGSPVGGVKVRLKSGANTYHATTDGAGSYEITDIPCNTYALEVMGQGYRSFKDHAFKIDGHILFNIPLNP